MKALLGKTIRTAKWPLRYQPRREVGGLRRGSGSGAIKLALRIAIGATGFGYAIEIMGAGGAARLL